MSELRYFWYWNRAEDWPPPTVQSPDEFDGGERLCVACTQTDLSDSAQRKLVRQWRELLPSLADVKYLWLNSRTPQSLFDSACRMPALQGLWVKWSGVKSIDAAAELPNLRAFHLGSSTGVQSIEVLAKLTRLQWLGLENLKQIETLEPLRHLRELIGLAIDGSMWTTQLVDTLEPVGDLSQLRYLSITNFKTRDKTLAPLLQLRRLETLHAAQWWNDAEVEELRRRNPRLAD